MDWKYIESVEEILPEGTGIDSRFQIAVRCGQHPHIDGKRHAAADAFKLPLLEHAKQSDLRICGRSPISSRKMVPPSAASKRPTRRCSAPVKAPFSCPKSSDAISEGEIAAQLTRMNARADRFDRLWIARAINCLPVPVSPETRTVESVGATFATCAKTLRSGAEEPTISSNIEVGPRRIPPHQASLFVVERLVLDKEPAILTILPPRPLFDLERKAA